MYSNKDVELGYTYLLVFMVIKMWKDLYMKKGDLPMSKRGRET